jgi:hypothetical protein
MPKFIGLAPILTWLIWKPTNHALIFAAPVLWRRELGRPRNGSRLDELAAACRGPDWSSVRKMAPPSSTTATEIARSAKAPPEVGTAPAEMREQPNRCAAEG